MMKFYIVDAFTETLFGGNPAGVVILDGDFPEEEVMQKTAAELRYSETAFIKRSGEKEFNIRYFTPAAEVELCGHATIGAFYALADAGLADFQSSYINHTLAGSLKIDMSSGSVMMDMAVPQAMGIIQDKSKIEELYRVMGISEENQGAVRKGEKSGTVLMPELISTGLPDILLPVRDEEQLAAIAPDFPALTELSRQYHVVGLHAFTPNAEDGAFHCRNFAPLYDIKEEAATGTSNGALTYYLYKNGLLKANSECLFIQGEAMNRPSKIKGRLDDKGGKITVQVGGTAVILAKGEINI